MKVVEVFTITNVGIGVFLNVDTFLAPKSIFDIVVLFPTGGTIKRKASKEFARKLPQGEVQTLLIRDTKIKDIPVGSEIKIIFP